MCDCGNKTQQLAAAEVPDFTASELSPSSQTAVQINTLNTALSTLQDVEALSISGCVTGKLFGKNICFIVPILGRYCVPSPAPIPANAKITVCFQSCGSPPILTGFKLTIYINGKAVNTIVIGRC
ncbi:MAG: hypothetical protein ACKO45_01430 [Cyanobium sp.]